MSDIIADEYSSSMTGCWLQPPGVVDGFKYALRNIVELKRAWCIDFARDLYPVGAECQHANIDLGVAYIDRKVLCEVTTQVVLGHASRFYYTYIWIKHRAVGGNQAPLQAGIAIDLGSTGIVKLRVLPHSNI